MGPGALFERFAVLFVEHLNDVTLVQRGSSISGNPVGGALDATSADGRIAVEASVRKDYFVRRMTKPKSDLGHVLELTPQVRCIFLLCSQRAPAGAIENFVAAEGKNAAMAGRDLFLMDGRGISEQIVDNLMLKDNAIDALSELLPVIRDIRDDHPATLTPPLLDDGHIGRDDVAEELARRLASSACVEIAGIGGIGKSVSAAAYLRRHRQDFEYCFWIDARVIAGVQHLSAVQLHRGGAERNVLGLLKKSRCLVVLDDAPDSLTAEDLIAAGTGASRIIVTRRRIAPGAYELPMMQDDEARAVLNRHLDEPASAPVVAAILRAVGGHPLSLKLLNSAIRVGASWQDVADDCERLGSLPDGEALLADRVMGRLRPILAAELSVFVWAGQPTCDREFLKSEIDAQGLRKLQEYGLNAPESPSSTRLHDIVFTSLIAGGWLAGERSGELDDRLEKYVLEQMRGNGHGLQTIAAQLSRKMRENVSRGDRRPAFVYALISAWGSHEVDPTLLPDPMALAADIARRGAAKLDPDILLVLETVEALYRYDKHFRGYSSAQCNLESALPIFDLLGTTPGLGSRQVAEIKHHHAKALKLLGRHEEAKQLFEEALTIFPLSEAMLQLVRLHSYQPEGIERARELSRAILVDSIGHGASASVLMGLADTLNAARSNWAAEIMAEHEEVLLAQCLYSAAAGVPQGYEALASFARALAWCAPEQLPILLQRLPEPTALMLDDERSRAGFAEILFHAAHVDAGRTLVLRALDAYETLRSPDAYQKRRWGETLLKLGRWEEAKNVLSGIDEPTGRIWVAHSLSQVELALGKLPEALSLANEAIAGAVGRHVQYRGSFLLQRIKVRIEMGDRPLDDIEEAVQCSDNGRLLDALAEERRRCAEPAIFDLGPARPA